MFPLRSRSRPIGYKGGHERVLFVFGDLPIRTRAALIGFGTLALLLLSSLPS
jgi:hypothetical protein